jgi:hypothetical protein
VPDKASAETMARPDSANNAISRMVFIGPL